MKGKRIVAVLFTILILTCSLVVGQTKARTLQEGKPFPNQPVLVVEKWLGQAQITQETFQSGSNWLRNLRVDVRNVSQKPITHIYCILLLQKQGAMEAAYALPLLYEYGRPPIRPGEVVSLQVSEEQHSRAIRFLEKYQAKDIEKALLTTQYVYFDDNTRWVTGAESRQDPFDQTKWIPISQGKPLQRWPIKVFFEL